MPAQKCVKNGRRLIKKHHANFANSSPGPERFRRDLFLLFRLPLLLTTFFECVEAELTKASLTLPRQRAREFAHCLKCWLPLTACFLSQQLTHSLTHCSRSQDISVSTTMSAQPKSGRLRPADTITAADGSAFDTDPGLLIGSIQSAPLTQKCVKMCVRE